MSAPGSIIRLFVSSAFADFAVERDVLQRMVFPRIRQICAEQGFRFQPIDLRWGVSREAGNEKRTLSICFEEIRRCQQLSPDFNFLILLGDRYGSCFLPASIPSTQVARLLPHLDQGLRILFDSDNPAVAYREDLNAVPAEYVLLPAPPGGRDEESLRLALGRAAHIAGFSNEEALPFRSSATHLEIQRGLLAAEAVPEAVLCAIRTFAPMPKGQEARLYIEEEPARRAQVEDLQASVEARLAARVSRYTMPWHAGKPVVDREKLSAHLLALLESRVRAVISQRQQAAQGRDAVTEANRRFTAERTSVIEGRDDELARVAAYLDGDVQQPLVVTGASGVGKSSLLARAAVDAARAYPQAVIVARYIGITPKTSNLSDLLNGLRHEIAAHYGQPTPEPIADLSQLVAAVAQDLKTLTIPADRPLVLLIDALDQLSAQPQRVDWLPPRLSSHVRVVVSVLPDRRELANLRGWLPEGQILTLGPLTREQGAAVLQHLLNQESRHLQPVQERALLAGFAREGNALYLRLAVERARGWRSFDVVLSLPETIEGLLRDLFAELARDDRHGPALAAHALGDLGAAKNGLAEDEMLDVLGQDSSVSEDLYRLSPDSPRVDVNHKLPLPVVLWARLYADLEPYLTERDVDGTELITFYHRQLREAVEDQYLHGEDGVAQHRALAEYFGAQPLWLGDHVNGRQLSELPFQQALGHLHDDLKRTLTDVGFLMCKIRMQSTGAVLQDLAFLREDAIVGLLASTIQMGASVLDRAPDQLANQIRGRVGWIEGLHDEIGFDEPTLSLMTPSLSRPDPALTRVYQGHTGGANACAFSPDTRTIVSASDDRSLRIWDVGTGECTHILMGHSAPVLACAFSPDGSMILSASADKTLRLWDSRSGECIGMTPEGLHTSRINACAFSPDGLLALSASDNGMLFVWRVKEGVLGLEQATSSPQDNFTGCAFSPDGSKVLAATTTGYLRLWYTGIGEYIESFQNSIGFTCCAFHPDGRRVIGGSVDKYLHMYEIGAGSSKVTFWRNGHTEDVLACAFSTDGTSLLSTSQDGSVRIWDTATQESVEGFFGHRGSVYGGAFSDDGRYVLSAAADSTIRLWDRSVKTPQTKSRFHTGRVLGCVFNHAGTQAASSSADDTVLVWDMVKGQCALQLTRSGGEAYESSFSPDDGWLVSGRQDSTISLWDLKRKQPVLRGLHAGHCGRVTACCYSPDGRYILSGTEDKTLRLWDVRSGECRREFNGHDYPITSCAFDKTGKRIISGSFDNTVRVWNVETGEQSLLIKEPAVVHDCVFSPNGQYLLSASRDGGLRLWLTANGTLVRTFEGHTDYVWGCAFSPDGELCISASSDATLRLWDTATGQLIHRWVGDGELLSCAFHPLEPIVMAGDEFGGVHFLRIMNLHPERTSGNRLGHVINRLVRLGRRERPIARWHTWSQTPQLIGDPPQEKTGPGLVFRRDAFVVPFDYPKQPSGTGQADDAVSWNNIGTAFAKQERFQEAIDAFEKAIHLNPEYAISWHNLGTAYGFMAHYQEAANAFQHALALQANDADTWRLLGNTYALMNRHLEEAEAYQQVVRLDPGDVDSWQALGTALSNLERHQEAATAYREALDIDPDHASAWGSLGNTLTLMQNDKEAEQAYRQALRLHPDDANLWHILGNALGRQDQYQEALSAYEHAISLDATDADTWRNLGIIFDLSERHQEAAGALQHATSLRPDDPDIWNSLGNALDHQERNQEAADAYERALSLRPDDPDIWHNLGVTCVRQERYEDAADAYQQAARLDPDNADRWFTLGTVPFFWLHHYQEAAEAFQKAISLKPDSTNSWNLLAYSFFHQGLYDDALTSIESALALVPEDGNNWDSKGEILIAMRRYDEAVGALRQACDLGYDTPASRERLTHALRALGRDAGTDDGLRSQIEDSDDDSSSMNSR